MIMKHGILVTLMFFIFSVCILSAAPQSDEKSEAEKYMQKVSKMLSDEDEIDYAYISTSMFKQMFGMFDGYVTMNGIGGIVGEGTFPLKRLRRFITTGNRGYKKLTAAMSPFLIEDELVMGMEIMALSREDGIFSVIYSDNKNLLVINNDYEELSVVFIVGLTFDVFMKMHDGGFELDF